MRGAVTPDQAVAALAAGRGGVVARAELLACGLSADGIARRIAAARLHVVHRNVYAVGHAGIGAAAHRWAAVLACGAGAALSHDSAAAVWDLRRAGGSRIDVTVPDRRRIRLDGIVVHRPLVLPSDETTTCDGLPVTTAARTVLDLAATGLRGRPLEAALDRAEQLRVLDFREVELLLERHAGRPGVPELHATLARYVPGTVVTRSELEERFIALCDRHGLPQPAVNARVAGFEVDFLWARAGVVAEVDGYAYHRSPQAMSTDHERDVALVLSGFRVLRFTWRDVTKRASYVAKAVRHALAGSPDRA
jgi:hypothetical protein